MDLKATTLLKLVYLEMLGYDMSWAAFHVLEVMSSPKNTQKRIGYLAAIQSFRSDTEVLMLTTNLMKKDICSNSSPTVSLPLTALPHIITPSLALSLSPDILLRLNHSRANIRKKGIATLYRTALVYPEILKIAWPRIIDLLSDREQDPSVTTALVNIICELGWRRPRDFLPIAPRLFELLVNSNNNWMTIKIIKLFAALTPIEPRLIRKLQPPLINIIQTTPAMSLLYECINGIIHDGTFAHGSDENEAVATLCIAKLRGMIIIDGDPNLRYVALIALNRILASHSHLVIMQQDIIRNCIEDSDISIRLIALELGIRMIDNQSIVWLVEQLLTQLEVCVNHPSGTDVEHGRRTSEDNESSITDGKRPEVQRWRHPHQDSKYIPLPRHYRYETILKIIEMCSKRLYAHIDNFGWYVSVLVRILSLEFIHDTTLCNMSSGLSENDNINAHEYSILYKIGCELQNLAVRVSAVRATTVNAAYDILRTTRTTDSLILGAPRCPFPLTSAVWIVGEFVQAFHNAAAVMESLLHPALPNFPVKAIRAFVQAIPKVFACIISNDRQLVEEQGLVTSELLASRIVSGMERLSKHIDLEVQERVMQLCELLKLIYDHMNDKQAAHQISQTDAADILSRLFNEISLNPVAPDAQRRVTKPSSLQLEYPINSDLPGLLADSVPLHLISGHQTTINAKYSCRSSEVTRQRHNSSQNVNHPGALELSKQKTDGNAIASQKAFTDSDVADEYTIDQIPIVDLQLDDMPLSGRPSLRPRNESTPSDIYVMQDEALEGAVASSSQLPLKGLRQPHAVKVLQQQARTTFPILTKSHAIHDQADANLGPQTDESATYSVEMHTALQHVERIRLQMQRDAERVQATDGAPSEGQPVRRKTRKTQVSSISVRSKKPKGNSRTKYQSEINATPDEMTVDQDLQNPTKNGAD